MVGQEALAERERAVRGWYSDHVYQCRLFEQRFADHLTRALRQAQLADAKLETRTKAVDSYVRKALTTRASGDFKYVDPRAEITDAVGARVVVPLSTDLPPVVALLKEIYAVDEEVERLDEETGVDVPGYRSLHLLVRLEAQERTHVDFLTSAI